MSNNVTRHIPNFVTCLNLFSGCIACLMAFHAEYRLAFFFILLSALFDFLDGMLARLLKAYSPIGKDLDSLADNVSFGAAPAFIAFSLLAQADYPAFLEKTTNILPYAGFLISVFSALRLAKFNNDGITVGNAVTQAQLRDKIQLQGTGLNYVTEVYVNGLQLSDFEKSEATINLTIPEKTPIGERAGTDANIIRLVNEFGEELEYGFTIIGQQPVLTHVADADGTVITSALCGETVQAVGKYLESVSGITCNGVSVTTYEVDAEGTNITFTIPENLPTGESYAENNLVE